MTPLPVIDALTTIPVLVPHVLPSSPVVVPNVPIVVFLVMPVPVIVVFLGEGNSAGEAERQGRYSQSSQNTLHSHLRFRTGRGRCQKDSSCFEVRKT